VPAPVYVGDDLRAIKWRNWKLHYTWPETKRSPVERFSTVPKLVDLIRDPRETRNLGEPYNGWIQFPMIELALEFQKSMQRYPNVPVGGADGYEP
jgi:arylsulfatase